MKKKEIFRFFISGCTAVTTDFTSYFFLKNFFSLSVAKGLSFICGTLVAYLLNKYWTFQVKEKSIKEIMRFFSLYAFSLCINVAVNKVTLNIFPEAYVIAFLAATATSTVLNFIGQKWWVFKEVKI